MSWFKIATCQLCEGENKFSVPWDEIGIELMKAHINREHPGGWEK